MEMITWRKKALCDQSVFSRSSHVLTDRHKQIACLTHADTKASEKISSIMKNNYFCKDVKKLSPVYHLWNISYIVDYFHIIIIMQGTNIVGIWLLYDVMYFCGVSFPLFIFLCVVSAARASSVFLYMRLYQCFSLCSMIMIKIVSINR